MTVAVAGSTMSPPPNFLSPTPDAELLEGIVERRPHAFEALVATFQNRLYGLAWRVTGNREDAEEAVQDALVRAHRALFGAYSTTRLRELALRPWLFAVTLNAARNRLRGRRPVRSLDETSPDGRLLLEPGSADLGPPATVENQDLRTALELALRELPYRYRTAVVLRLVEDLSYAEAAQVLDRPVGTVKSDVHRGLRRLRRRLGPLLED